MPTINSSNAVILERINNLIERFDKFEERQADIEKQRLDEVIKVQALVTGLESARKEYSDKIEAIKEDYNGKFDDLGGQVKKWNSANTIGGIILSAIVAIKWIVFPTK